MIFKKCNRPNSRRPQITLKASLLRRRVPFLCFVSYSVFNCNPHFSDDAKAGDLLYPPLFILLLPINTTTTTRKVHTFLSSTNLPFKTDPNLNPILLLHDSVKIKPPRSENTRIQSRRRTPPRSHNIESKPVRRSRNGPIPNRRRFNDPNSVKDPPEAPIRGKNGL
ncbi:hypothetical protein F2Q70_00045366 [Brassica cretica]|uniref:Uncharacterized protein n=1 Tax=Brassica cretica TaxID=69181 RepID=A0A8S9KDJ0_BRACR|nr:hypothetical protein F2Q70_00045366 [Brassica cretica]